MTDQHHKLDLNIESISKNIRTEVMRHGFLWVSAAIILLYSIVGYYLLLDSRSSSYTNIPFFTAGIALLLVAYFIFRLSVGKKHYKIFWCVSAFLMSVSIVVLASLTEFVWDCPDGGKKILLIGFLVMLISWNVSKTILMISISPIIILYTFLSYNQPNAMAIDVVLSIIKFPLLMLMFYSTINKFFSSAEQRFIEKITTIQRLERNSHLDELTRINNRRGFNSNLKTAVGVASRLGSDLSVAILDIDFFKQYNDSLGHPAGDLCLKTIAAILNRECKRAADTVARIGGEEFAIIMPGTSSKNAMVVAGEIHKALRKTCLIHPSSSIASHVTTSIGITQFYSGDDFNSLYERADKAMYKAKVAGRNRSVVCENTCTNCE